MRGWLAYVRGCRACIALLLQIQEIACIGMWSRMIRDHIAIFAERAMATTLVHVPAGNGTFYKYASVCLESFELTTSFCCNPASFLSV